MKRILVIDDSTTIRHVVGITLKGAGYEVIEASDGLDALQKLENELLHLVICDVNMPNLDGLSFVKELKTNPKYEKNKFLPVIMLTTVVSEEKKLEGQQAGAKAWIVKPFLPEKLLNAVQKLIM